MNDAVLFLLQYGVLVLFVVVFVEQIGLPLPAIPVLIAAGALAGVGQISLWMTIGITVAAAVTADWIWYELGRRRGRRVLGWLCRIALEPDSCIRTTETFFMKHGAFSLVLAKFIPGLSTIAPPLAGIVGLGIPLFFLYDGLGALIWAGSSVGIGYVFSNRLEEALAYAEHLGPAVLLSAVVGLVGYVCLKAVHRRRQLRGVPRITVGELAEKLGTAAEAPVLIDVRSGVSLEAAPAIPGARVMALDELARRHIEIPRDRDVVLYCGCPEDAASAQGTLLLRKLGFTRIWALAGGIGAWQAQQTALSQLSDLCVENGVSV